MFCHDLAGWDFEKWCPPPQDGIRVGKAKICSYLYASWKDLVKQKKNFFIWPGELSIGST